MPTTSFIRSCKKMKTSTQISDSDNDNDNDNVRMMSELPDDILFSSILSSLTVREIARTNLVSRHWNRSLRYLRVLNFEDSNAHLKISRTERAMSKFKFNFDLLYQERFIFIDWVKDILANHVGSFIDEFKLTFDLDNTYQNDIDTWVVWAFLRHVKKLELNFNPAEESMFCYRKEVERKLYTLEPLLVDVCYHEYKIEPLLTSLCLKNVNVSTLFVEKLLACSAITLQHLCIEKSKYLTSIEVCGSSSLQSLKSFRVIDCPNMKTINISAPNLLSFTYDGSSLELLDILNASSLSHVTLMMHLQDHITQAFDSLTKYFSHLEFLKLRFFFYGEINLGINSCPILPNLKHLDLSIYTHCGPYDDDIDFVNFVLAKCDVLQEIIYNSHPIGDLSSAKQAVSYLKIPQGVKMSLIYDGEVISM